MEVAKMCDKCKCKPVARRFEKGITITTIPVSEMDKLLEAEEYKYAKRAYVEFQYAAACGQLTSLIGIGERALPEFESLTTREKDAWKRIASEVQMSWSVERARKERI
jgi:hypothetical protein